jgi:hypothetical protein
MLSECWMISLFKKKTHQKPDGCRKVGRPKVRWTSRNEGDQCERFKTKGAGLQGLEKCLGRNQGPNWNVNPSVVAVAVAVAEKWHQYHQQQRWINLLFKEHYRLNCTHIQT